MRVIRRVVIWTVGVVAFVVALIVLSIPLDGVIGGARVDSLTNARIPNANGPGVRAHVSVPVGPGPHPAVIVIHEWWGLNEEIIGKADALAQEGYLVVAPDTFRGSSTSWIPRAIYQVSTTRVEDVNQDLAAVFDWLESRSDVRSDRVGIVGFCYGGRAGMSYSLIDSRIAATATLYGLATTDSTELRALPGPVLGIFGGADNSISIERVHALEAALNEAGVPNEITIYQDQPHAFVRSIDEIRQGGPQREAWDQLLDFLHRSLHSPAAMERPRPLAEREIAPRQVRDNLFSLLVHGVQHH